MKKQFLFVVPLLVLTFIPCLAHSSKPVLFFSDITSGPRTGLGDGLGEGAIVTIWGRNLGSSQGSSKVYFKDSLNNIYQAAYVYYWENADPETGLSGPSDMWTYHKMQEIAFSVPSAAPFESGTIHVEVGGIESNGLDFTVRSTGNICHVKVGGSNSNSGTWSSPWATVSGTYGQMGAGGIVYVGDGVVESSGLDIVNRDGTPENPYSVIAYPGADYLISGNSFGIRNWYVDSATSSSEYWNFAKIRIETNGSGYYGFLGGRVIGCSFTDIDCASGQGGAIVIMRRHGGVKALGNYIYEFGCPSTSYLHHTTYITNRFGSPIPSPELGWNYLRDNEAPYGLHLFDEGACGDMYGTYKVHDNVVVNQFGSGITVTSLGSGTCISMPVEIYNNLLINTGGDYSWNTAVYFAGGSNRCHIKFYNNVFYGYGRGVMTNNGALGTFGGTWEWKNNIVVDTNNVGYLYDYYSSADPSAASNNIWYNGGDGNPASPPSWDTAPLTSNPLFVDPAGGDFHLEGSSPAINAGSSTVSAIVTRDIDGVSRPRYLEYDIGAYEYIVSPPKNLRIVP